MEKVLHARRVEEDWRLAVAVHAGLPRDATERANLLLVGPERSMHTILELLLRECGSSVPVWCPDKPLVLPPVEQTPMMVLRNVARMSQFDQRRLNDWLNQAECRTQIVSTAPEPPFPCVQAGLLCSTLYYRLNTLYVEVRS